MIGICICGLFFTLPISVQSASPRYIWARVRPCIVSAAMPTSCRRRAISSMFFDSSSQPRRVFTVTGFPTASTIRRVISTISGTSRIMPDPAPRPAIFFTGQPKLMSMMSGPAASAMRAASTIGSTRCP